jgi:hypothetical protein
VRVFTGSINSFRTRLQIANEIIARGVVEHMESWIVTNPGDWPRLLVAEIAAALELAEVRQ